MAKAQACKTRVDHRYARLKELVLRVMLSGAKSCYCEFTRRRRVFPGRADVLGLSETRVSARAILADGYQGIDPIEARKPNLPMPTLGAFLEGDCAQYATANERAYAKNLSRLQWAFRKFLVKLLDQVSSLQIERWRAREVRRRVERDSANHWRDERGYVQLPSLLSVVFTDHVKPLILRSINTGCRRGEMLAFTWSNVDMERRILTVTGATAKSRRTRHIPLNREATSVLTNWRMQFEVLSGLVFVNDAGEQFDRVNTSWRRLLKDAGITDFRWHDIRHHFASRLAMGGVDLNSIRELLGHSDYTMTLR